MTRICDMTSSAARGVLVLATFVAIVLLSASRLAQAAPPPGARPANRRHVDSDVEEAAARAAHVSVGECSARGCSSVGGRISQRALGG